MKHAGAVLVAVAFAALALAEGGFSTKLVASLAIVVWWVVIAGLLVRGWPGAEPRAEPLLCGAALAALACLSGLSLLWAGDAGRAFEATMRTGAYLGLFAFVVLASRRGSARRWLVGLAWGIGFVAALSLFSRFDPGALGAADAALAFDLPGAVGRLSYPIGYWNGLAAIMAFGIVLASWLGAHAGSRLARASAVAVLPAFALVIVLAQSRGGALAALVGVLVLAVFVRGQIVTLLGAATGALGGLALALLANAREELWAGALTPRAHDQGLEMAGFTLLAVGAAGALRYVLDPSLTASRIVSARLRPRQGIAALSVVAALAVTVVAVSGRLAEFSDPGAYVAPRGDEGHVTSLRGSGRAQFWSVAIDAYSSAPVAGIGAGNYDLYWNANNPIPAVIQHAHSLYLQTLAEVGIPGLLLVVGFLGLAAWAAWQRNPLFPGGEAAAGVAVLATGAVSAGLEWTWEIPAAFGPVILAAALLTGPATLPRGAREVEANAPGGPLRGPRGRFGLGVGAILAGFLSIWIAGVSLLTEIRIEDSQSAAARGELAAAVDAADAAATIQPWSPEPYLQLAQVEELRGRLPQARAALDEAMERAREDWRIWLVEARIALQEGDRDHAGLAFRRAQELSPAPLEAPLPPGGAGVSGS